jgi:hypothetical protein
MILKLSRRKAVAVPPAKPIDLRPILAAALSSRPKAQDIAPDLARFIALLQPRERTDAAE